MSFFKTRDEKLSRRAFKAADAGNMNKLEQALIEGADIEAQNRYGSTLLFFAVRRKDARAAKLLIAYGADVNFERRDAHSCLMEAAEDGSYDIAKMLLERGANIHATDGDKNTALHLAAQYGRGDTVKLLLANGADASAVNARMNTAADLADKDHPRLADFIRGKKSDETPAVKPAGWHLTAPDEVCSIAEKAEIGYRLTEIFNFGAGIYTRIAHNLQSGAESQSVRFFDEFTNRAAIDAAQKAFVELGGDCAALKTDKPGLKPAAPPERSA